MTAITAALTAGTAVQLSNGRHHWEADEPPDAGGSDTGPNPYELLLGALAACTCITISLYAEHKGIALRQVSARFEHDRVHARDCEGCVDDEDKADEGGVLDRITSDIVISADVDAGQEKRLAAVALRCPVHRVLEGQVVFTETVRFA